jgi:multisubunit Na+/H+ antiporter MnhF subunit
MLLEIVAYLLAYLVLSFLAGIAIGKLIKRGREGLGDDNE